MSAYRNGEGKMKKNRFFDAKTMDDFEVNFYSIFR
jgi:hypothetical protein